MTMILTKDYLKYLGITEVSEDGTIYTKHGPKKPQRAHTNGKKYQKLQFYVQREDKAYNLFVHKIVWTWFNGIIPADMEIHHKDFDPTNNAIANLECLTHEEHLERHGDRSTVEMKCRLDIPREWYVKKIETTTGSSKYVYKCKLRYFDSHIEEHKKMIKLKEEIEMLKYLKKHFKEIGDTRRWHQFRQLELNWESYEDSIREKIMTSVIKYCI